MKRKNMMVVAAVIATTVFWTSCTSAKIGKNNLPSANGRETIYQVSLLQSLMLGDYYGSVTIDELKRHGDIGIGTFDCLNGELVMLDGVVYQALYDGTIAVPNDSLTVPFSNVTFFDSDVKLKISKTSSTEDLKNKMTSEINKLGSNSFYMAKINAHFDSIQYRSEYAQKEPYKPLAEVMLTDQVIFNSENITGTIVALYCPNYMDGLNTTGWHFHFISSDRRKGGHVLDLKFAEADVFIDKTSEFNLILPDEKFFEELNLTEDLEEAINKVEKNTDR